MAWASKKYNKNSMLGVQQEVCTLPGSATIGYSSEISFLSPNKNVTNKYVYLHAAASEVSGTNVDISLYGAWEVGGTKILLTDAPGSIADLTTSAKAAFGKFDLNAYPMPYYYIGFTADADEDANSITLTLIY